MVHILLFTFLGQLKIRNKSNKLSYHKYTNDKFVLVDDEIERSKKYVTLYGIHYKQPSN